MRTLFPYTTLFRSQLVVALPTRWIQLILGLFILYAAWAPMPKLGAGGSGARVVAGGGLVSTFLTIFIGATGPFVAAMLKPFALGRIAHVGTMAACMTVQHLIKIVVFGLLGFAFAPYLALVAAMIAAGFIGTYAGRQVLMRTSDQRFSRLLNIILTLLAARLLWTAITGLTASGT